MTENRYAKLDQLGEQQALPASPEAAILERVNNPCNEPYMIRLVAPEFTSICPVTGQPDFAHLVVDYCPDKWIVESWYPRGGIPIDVFYQYGTPPKGLWIPDQGVPPYRGRG